MQYSTPSVGVLATLVVVNSINSSGASTVSGFSSSSSFSSFSQCTYSKQDENADVYDPFHSFVYVIHFSFHGFSQCSNTYFHTLVF